MYDPRIAKALSADNKWLAKISNKGEYRQVFEVFKLFLHANQCSKNELIFLFYKHIKQIVGSQKS